MSRRRLTALLPLLENIDRLLADRLCTFAEREQPPAEGELVAIAAGLTGHWRDRGHACLPLRSLPEYLLSPRLEAPVFLPRAAELLAALRRSTLVVSAQVAATPEARPTPLVLDGQDRLYFWRYFQAEQRLASRLRELAQKPPAALEVAKVAPLFAKLFPEPEKDRQAWAAAACLLRPLWLICGGPGTGKTTTVAKLLALELEARDAPPRIALAAPTGKAATRLYEALGQQLEKLPIADTLREHLPRQARTLHRLLKFEPRRERFGHNARNPLPYELLVVDEASMVDLLLMDALFAALPPQGRIVLLGDKDQLASVETGSVFGDLSAAAIDGGFRPETRAALAPLLGGDALPPEDPPRLPDTAVELVRSYRFENQPGIGALATAIRQRQVEKALEVLAETRPDVGIRPHPEKREDLLAPFEAHLEAYLATQDPGEALDQLSRFRLIAVFRGGLWGVEALNLDLERHLLNQYGHPTGGRFYAKKPILVRANDYENELFNGDLGVVWEEPGHSWAFFPDGRGGLRRLALAKLPVHDTAWAMTVHQSQGSELDHVLFVLPDRDHPLLGRELLYTGITRARKRVDLVGTPALIEAAIQRPSVRHSGLLDALQAP